MTHAGRMLAVTMGATKTSAWQNKSKAIFKSKCSVDDDPPPFDYGIFKQALSSGIISSKKFITKYLYCLWWGLQNLR
jgi:cyclic nucleotide gated channel, plant